MVLGRRLKTRRGAQCGGGNTCREEERQAVVEPHGELLCYAIWRSNRMGRFANMSG